MCKVELISSSDGTANVRTINAVRDYSVLRLRESFFIVSHFLEGNRITVECSTMPFAIKLMQALQDLGVESKLVEQANG